MYLVIYLLISKCLHTEWYCDYWGSVIFLGGRDCSGEELSADVINSAFVNKW